LFYLHNSEICIVFHFFFGFTILHVP
jgi:hypothetical protein